MRYELSEPLNGSRQFAGSFSRVIKNPSNNQEPKPNGNFQRGLPSLYSGANCDFERSASRSIKGKYLLA